MLTALPAPEIPPLSNMYCGSPMGKVSPRNSRWQKGGRVRKSMARTGCIGKESSLRGSDSLPGMSMLNAVTPFL